MADADARHTGTEPALSGQKLHLWILVIGDQKTRIPLGKAGQKFGTLWGILVTLGMLLAPCS